MPQMKIEIDGDVQLSRSLRIAAKNLSKMKDFHKEAINIMSERSDDLFKKEGSNVEKNPKWKSLSTSTKKARTNRWGYYKKQPKNPSKLRWTGRLQEDRTEKATNAFGLLQFNAPYAEFHQKGGKNLPRRAIIDLDNNTNTKMTKALQKKVERDLGIFGLQL